VNSHDRPERIKWLHCIPRCSNMREGKAFTWKLRRVAMLSVTMPALVDHSPPRTNESLLFTSLPAMLIITKLSIPIRCARAMGWWFSANDDFADSAGRPLCYHLLL
jgi:hypothetical protein